MHQPSDEPDWGWPAWPSEPESTGNGHRASVQIAEPDAGTAYLLPMEPPRHRVIEPPARMEPDGQRIRDRWLEVQLHFLDDPRGAADEAERLVDETVAATTAALIAQRDRLRERRRTSGTDTERLRAALRDYRDLLDRVLGL